MEVIIHGCPFSAGQDAVKVKMGGAFGWTPATDPAPLGPCIITDVMDPLEFLKMVFEADALPNDGHWPVRCSTGKYLSPEAWNCACQFRDPPDPARHLLYQPHKKPVKVPVLEPSL